MDCSSTSELYICKKLGITGENVMCVSVAPRRGARRHTRAADEYARGLCGRYTSNYTSKADLATAFDMGCVMNLDDMTLVRCAEHAACAGARKQHRLFARVCNGLALARAESRAPPAPGGRLGGGAWQDAGAHQLPPEPRPRQDRL